jgi:hypothetical protein
MLVVVHFNVYSMQKNLVRINLKNEFARFGNLSNVIILKDRTYTIIKTMLEYNS